MYEIVGVICFTTAARTAEILLIARGRASLIDDTGVYGCGRRKSDEHSCRRPSQILDPINLKLRHFTQSDEWVLGNFFDFVIAI